MQFFNMKQVRKIQNVKFSSVDDFFNFLPDDELQIVNLLRKMILDIMPDVEEKLSYNVLYYKRNKGIFFLWPASILWGKRPTHKGVRLGFQQGYLLADELEYLDKGDRKQVYWIDIETLSGIDKNILKAYIFEAMAVDNQLKRL